MNVIQEDSFGNVPWPVPTKEHPVRFVLWPYVHVYDAAMSCCLALEADVAGHEAVFIAADNMRFDADTKQLLTQFAPQVEIRDLPSGPSSVICIDKAKRLLGFEPHYNWRRNF